MNELTIKRMRELENMVKNNHIIYPLDIKEWRYVERASKISYEEAIKQIEYFDKTVLPIENIKYVYNLLATYNCTFDVLNQRLEDVCKIKEYKNKINNNLLKEQKIMIKRINHNR